MLFPIFGPGRVDQRGPTFRIGPNCREDLYLSQQLVWVRFGLWVEDEISEQGSNIVIEPD
jgi:hypothetical protein